MRAHKNNLVIVGILLHIGFNSLLQDYMGKAGYVDYVQGNWTDPCITVPIAIGIILFAALIYRSE